MPAAVAVMMVATTVATASMVVMIAATTSMVMVVAATAAAAFATHAVEHRLNLFKCGFTVFYQQTGEIERLTGQGVVGVNGHPVFGNLHHTGHEVVLFFVE